MNSPASEPHGSKRPPLPNPLPVRRGEGEATPRSLSALIQRQWASGLWLIECVDDIVGSDILSRAFGLAWRKELT
jgi:hypothetical protein